MFKKKFTKATGGKEQGTPKRSFMQELDDWTNARVICPLLKFIPEREYTMPDGDAEFARACEEIERAVRGKVLESYRNGQAAGLTPPAAGRTVPGKGGTR